MSKDKLRDGRAINFPSVPWHRSNGQCPALGDECSCQPGGISRAFCKQVAENTKKAS